MPLFSTLKFLNYEISIIFVCRFELATPPSTPLAGNHSYEDMDWRIIVFIDRAAQINTVLLYLGLSIAQKQPPGGVVQKNFTKSTEKHTCQSFFSLNLKVYLQLCGKSVLYSRFIVNLLKSLRAAFQYTCEWLFQFTY